MWWRGREHQHGASVLVVGGGTSLSLPPVRFRSAAHHANTTPARPLCRPPQTRVRGGGSADAARLRKERLLQLRARRREALAQHQDAQLQLRKAESRAASRKPAPRKTAPRQPSPRRGSPMVPARSARVGRPVAGGARRTTPKRSPTPAAARTLAAKPVASVPLLHRQSGAARAQGGYEATSGTMAVAGSRERVRQVGSLAQASPPMARFPRPYASPPTRRTVRRSAGSPAAVTAVGGAGRPEWSQRPAFSPGAKGADEAEGGDAGGEYPLSPTSSRKGRLSSAELCAAGRTAQRPPVSLTRSEVQVREL